MVGCTLANAHAIRSLRGDLTVAQAAALAGIDTTTWWRIETQRVSPSIGTLLAIAQAFGVDMQTLLGHTSDSDTPATAGVKNRRGPSSAKTRAASTTKGA